MAQRQTTYEWVCELEDEHGDIIDCRFAETRAGAEALRDPDYTCRIALVKHEGNQLDSETARSYAYIGEDGQLGEMEGDADPYIPARFFKERASA
jgi:hypothetical protein